MTNDDKALVERLRSVDVSWSETGEWCAEAADRIEALETEAAENARIIGMSAEREMALRGEVERLREALRRIDTSEYDGLEVHRVSACQCHRIARAALEDPK